MSDNRGFEHDVHHRGGRTRIVLPDEALYEAFLDYLAEGGERAWSFRRAGEQKVVIDLGEVVMIEVWPVPPPLRPMLELKKKRAKGGPVRPPTT